MVNIIPFKGYRFNSEKISNPGAVMAPPYDTISRNEQDELYSRDEYNIVRLNKGIRYDSDNDVENCFTRSAKLLREWIDKNILTEEEDTAFYLYEQRVIYKNATYANLGLVGLLELQDLNSGNILQCEKSNETSKPVRMELLKHTKST